jgi:hypothetical protein
MTQATNLAALGSYITASSTGQIIVNNAGSLGLYDSTVPGIYFQRPVTTSEVNVPYIRAQANGTTTTDLALGASSSSGKILFYTVGTNVGSFDANGSFNILSSTNFGSLTPNALNGNLSIGGIGPAHTISFGTSNSGATGWVERLRLYSNAAQGSAGITSYETITFGTPNAGITFDNSSASVNSTLNDYETGTWTPSLLGTGGSGTTTYTGQNGYYTKIGNMVFATLALTWSARSGGSGVWGITGFPFSTINFNNGSNPTSPGVCSNFSGFTFTAGTMMTFEMHPTNNYGYFFTEGSGIGPSYLNTAPASSGYISIAIAYQATF